MAKRKAVATKLPSFIRTGVEAVGSGNSPFIGVKEGESILFAPLVEAEEILSLQMHEIWEIRPAIFIPCIGDGCSACESGHKSRFRAYLPVLTKEGDVKILPIGIKTFRDLKSIAEDISIKGKVMRLRRTGSGRYNTRYSLVAIGREQDVSKVEMPDVLAAIGPTTLEEIEKLWVKAGFVEGEDDEEVPAEEDDEEEVEAEIEDDDDDDWGDL